MSKLKVVIFVAALAGAALAVKVFSLYQAISPNPIVSWQVSNENNERVIDHRLWGEILSGYLSENQSSGVREFDYVGVSDIDKTKLANYLTYLQTIDPRNYNRLEQTAYWANLYNALTIDLILKHYPLDSIKNIGDGITGPWNMALINIANTPLTLNQIEHGILRGIFKDKRIHYVINCASIGCPDLPAIPLTSKNIERQLELGAFRFINQDKGMRFNENKLILSNIYNWFSVDFGENELELLRHLSQYATPKKQEKLRNFKGDIDFDYNWKLNQSN